MYPVDRDGSVQIAILNVMVNGEECFPISDIESPLSNTATDVNEVPALYATRVS
jgi:hypothetical protein